MGHSFPPRQHMLARLRALLQSRGEPTIGEYRLEGLVAVGNTDVYRGRRISGGPPVAIKVLVLTDPRNTQHFVRRFVREVEILRRLSHPGIVSFVDAGQDHGRLYLVQELAPQGDLRQVLTSDGLPLERFLALFIPICEAVAYAHRQGVIHRDLKPDNVLVIDGQRIKIADFGLARSRSLGTITTVATTLGTPVYMAPEQCLGRRVTAAADQYALGTLGYEMLVGTTPFSGGERLDVLTRHLYEDPVPPSARLSQPIPAALNDLLVRTLAKDPADRFGSLDEVVAILRDLPSR